MQFYFLQIDVRTIEPRFISQVINCDSSKFVEKRFIDA